MSASVRKEKEHYLLAFWRTVYQRGASMYPLMRLLLPQLDNDRPTCECGGEGRGWKEGVCAWRTLARMLYLPCSLRLSRCPPRSSPTDGLRESSLADAYIQALGLSKNVDQAQR